MKRSCSFASDASSLQKTLEARRDIVAELMMEIYESSCMISKFFSDQNFCAFCILSYQIKPQYLFISDMRALKHSLSSKADDVIQSHQANVDKLYRRLIDDLSLGGARINEQTHAIVSDIRKPFFRPLTILVLMYIKDEQQLISSLKFVPDAQFSKSSPICLPGTRIDAINDLINWATSKESPQFMWLFGPAGKGKSSLAGSVATILKNVHQLGAFYAFRRGDSAKRKLSNVFTSIAVQLAASDLQRRTALINILKGMDATQRATTSPIEQLESFVRDPCETVSSDMTKQTIIIIDAIDECEPAEDYHILLHALASIHLPPDIRILLTSRPHLKPFMKIGNLSQFNMDDIDNNLSDRDISLYISDEGANLDLGLDRNDVAILVAAAAQLFQWAVMAIRILYTTSDELDEALKELVKNQIRGNLDELYRKALDLAVDQDGEGGDKALERVKSRLGRLLVIKESLPLPSLVRLCNPSAGKGGNSDTKGFRKLAALLLGVNSEDQPVRPLHASFREYLLSQKEVDAFFIDTRLYESRLTLATLQVMNQDLKFNIADLPTSYLKNKDQQCGSIIPDHLSYACRFWGTHLKDAVFESSWQDLINTFLETKFLFWLEVLSLTGSLNVADQSLAELTQVNRYFINFKRESENHACR